MARCIAASLPPRLEANRRLYGLFAIFCVRRNIALSLFGAIEGNLAVVECLTAEGVSLVEIRRRWLAVRMK